MNNRGSNKNKTKSKMHRTSPPQRYSFSMINCLTTKSEEIVFN